MIIHIVALLKIFYNTSWDLTSQFHNNIVMLPMPVIKVKLITVYMYKMPTTGQTSQFCISCVAMLLYVISMCCFNIIALYEYHKIETICNCPHNAASICLVHIVSNVCVNTCVCIIIKYGNA